MIKDFKFNLGSEVKDKITGFTGIIQCRSQYLTGCNVYAIQSQKLKDNKPSDWTHLDEDRLILLKDKKINLDERKPTGGPHSKSEYSPSKN